VDPEVFGKYQLILSAVSLAMIFSLPGMSTALVQTVARGKDGFYEDAFRRSLRMSFLGSTGLAVFGAYYLLSDVEFSISVLLVAMFFPLLSVFGLWEPYWQGRERFDIAARNASIVAFVQSLSVSAAAFLFPEYLVVIVIAYAFSIGLTNVFFYQNSRSTIRNQETDGQSVKFGYFMTKMGFLGVLSEQIDKLLIGIFLGPSQLAAYAVISFFGIRVKDLVRPFSAMLVPKIANGKLLFHEIISIHRKPLILGMLGTFSLSMLFYALVIPLNELVFSKVYSGYGSLSHWYIVTVALSVPLTAMGYYIYARQNTYAVMLSNTVYHFMRIGINIFMIWKYGLVGAVLAYNFSMILLLLTYLWGIFSQEVIRRERSSGRT
jgi:O-antigen/teichoic acid export membrane protein